jgi:hypothetical protein
VRDLYVPTIDLPILLQEICGPVLEIYKSLTGHMNVEIGTEAVHFPKKGHINGIFVAVQARGFSTHLFRILETTSFGDFPFFFPGFVQLSFLVSFSTY